MDTEPGRAVGTQRVGGRMKPLLVKEHLRPSEAQAAGRDKHILMLQGHMSQRGSRPTEKMQDSDPLVVMCVCREEQADIREGLGPGGVTANEGVGASRRRGL